MPHQIALTIRATIRPGELSDVRDALADITKMGVPNRLLPFDALPGVHFARFFVLPHS